MTRRPCGSSLTWPWRHSNWGIVLLRMGQLEEAVSHFREALRIDPD